MAAHHAVHRLLLAVRVFRPLVGLQIGQLPPQEQQPRALDHQRAQHEAQHACDQHAPRGPRLGQAVDEHAGAVGPCAEVGGLESRERQHGPGGRRGQADGQAVLAPPARCIRGGHAGEHLRKSSEVGAAAAEPAAKHARRRLHRTGDRGGDFRCGHGCVDARFADRLCDVAGFDGFARAAGADRAHQESLARRHADREHAVGCIHRDQRALGPGRQGCKSGDGGSERGVPPFVDAGGQVRTLGVLGPLGHHAGTDAVAALAGQQRAGHSPVRRAPEHEGGGVELQRALEPAFVRARKLHRAHDHVGARERHHGMAGALPVDPLRGPCVFRGEAFDGHQLQRIRAGTDGHEVPAGTRAACDRHDGGIALRCIFGGLPAERVHACFTALGTRGSWRATRTCR